MLTECYLLAIETSCDDTCAAVLYNGKILANVISSQKEHEKLGGVVPELASRAHMERIYDIVEAAISKAGLSQSDIKAVAFTQRPGLIGSLLVGAMFAKGLSMALNIPLIAVNHMEAHVLSHFIDTPHPGFPFLCLTVSGGHTQIEVWYSFTRYEVLGRTLDDAAGEAFDKAAKMFGLSYPGGPILDKLAQIGNPDTYAFSIPNMKGYDFSYSGFKTSVLYFLRDVTAHNPHFIADNLADLCASVQKAIVSQLTRKLIKASIDTGIKEIAIAGGVSANSFLRSEVERLSIEYNWKVYIPALEYCTDNAAMIAIAGYFKFLENDFAPKDIRPQAS